MSIGKILKEEREKRNLTLEDVSKGTLIRTYYLENIENENFGNEFDGFILSYIRRYAEFLGINPEPLVNEYKNLFKEHELVLKKPSKNKRVLFVSLILLLIVVIVLFLISRGLTNKPVAVPKENTSQSETASSEETNTPQETKPSEETNPSATQTPQETKVKYPVSLVLEAGGRCWLGMNVDGTYSQRFINSGETLELNANKYIQIRYGNAKVVKVIFNGKDLGPVSTTETVVEIRYTEKGVEKIGNQ